MYHLNASAKRKFCTTSARTAIFIPQWPTAGLTDTLSPVRFATVKRMYVCTRRGPHRRPTGTRFDPPLCRPLCRRGQIFVGGLIGGMQRLSGMNLDKTLVKQTTLSLFLLVCRAFAKRHDSPPNDDARVVVATDWACSVASKTDPNHVFVHGNQKPITVAMYGCAKRTLL